MKYIKVLGLLAVAAVGLTIGGNAVDGGAAELLEAYRLTMWAAGSLAALSSLTAVLTITPREAAHPPASSNPARPT